MGLHVSVSTRLCLDDVGREWSGPTAGAVSGVGVTRAHGGGSSQTQLRRQWFVAVLRWESRGQRPKVRFSYPALPGRDGFGRHHVGGSVAPCSEGRSGLRLGLRTWPGGNAQRLRVVAIGAAGPECCPRLCRRWCGTGFGPVGWGPDLLEIWAPSGFCVTRASHRCWWKNLLFRGVMRPGCVLSEGAIQPVWSSLRQWPAIRRWLPRLSDFGDLCGQTNPELPFVKVLRRRDVSQVTQVAELISSSLQAVAEEPAGRAIVVLDGRRSVFVAFRSADSVPMWLLSGHDRCPLDR